jgi:hypothetical protein
MRFLRRLPALALVLLPIGCRDDGRGLAPVSGTVTYNGKPLPHAYLGFWPEEKGVRAASATTDKEGRYRLSTFQPHDGARVGAHRVVVRAEELPEGPPKAADDITAKRGRLLTPARYSSPETSGLTATVVARKNNVIDFQLTD